MSLLSMFQTLGATVGIVTGAFVIWDRSFRYSPAAFVVARGEHQKSLYLLVINRSERPLLVSWATGARDNEFYVKRDRSAISSVITVMDGHYAIVIEGKEEKTLPLSLPPNWDLLTLKNEIVKELRWRFAQPIWYKGVRTIDVSIDKKSLLLLQGLALNDKYHDDDGRAV